ncbi:MAG: PspC domain-containing protein [Propionibacteriaceae bacterium]|jgi:phage shock protein PspC (stress-responsive transcriptional regulator)|nr:PspC domain-containing protein [Propionibacteriaceae bacterium]
MRKHALTRNMANKKLAGVAAGLADFFGIDVTLIRVVFALGALFGGGVTVVLYIVLWFLLPKDSTTTTPPRRSSLATGIFIALVVAVVLLNITGDGYFGWIPAVVFIGLAVFLWWKFRSPKPNRQLGPRANHPRFQEPSATEAPPMYFGGDPTFHVDSFYPPMPPDSDNPSGFQRP